MATLKDIALTSFCLYQVTVSRVLKPCDQSLSLLQKKPDTSILTVAGRAGLH